MLGSGARDAGSAAVPPPAESGEDGRGSDDGDSDAGDGRVDAPDLVGDIQRGVLNFLFDRMQALEERCEAHRKELREERLLRRVWERRVDHILEYELCSECLEMRHEAMRSPNYDHKLGWTPWGCITCKRFEPFMVMPNELSEEEEESDVER